MQALPAVTGELIDEHLGLVLGLSTMASAAAGQVVSDFSGRLLPSSVPTALPTYPWLPSTIASISALDVMVKVIPACRGGGWGGGSSGADWLAVAGCARRCGFVAALLVLVCEAALVRGSNASAESCSIRRGHHHFRVLSMLREAATWSGHQDP